MITFDDVRRTDETTFFFFPDAMCEELEYFLELASIEHEILNHDQMQSRYPAIEIPAIPTRPSTSANPARLCRTPCVLISRLDTKDMAYKLWEIHRGPEARQWRRRMVEKIQADDAAHNERLKGWLPGLERESEAVR